METVYNLARLTKIVIDESPYRGLTYELNTENRNHLNNYRPWIIPITEDELDKYKLRLVDGKICGYPEVILFFGEGQKEVFNFNSKEGAYVFVSELRNKFKQIVGYDALCELTK